MNFRNEALVRSASIGGIKMDYETLWNEEEVEAIEELNNIFNL